MKKVLGLLLCVFLFAGSVPADASPQYNIGRTYSGSTHSPYVQQRIQFQDINGHWAEKSIYKAAALGLVSGQTNQLFKPDNTLSNAEAIAFAIRLKGLEATAQQDQEDRSAKHNDFKGVYPYNHNQNWARGYVQIAQQQGIFTEQEYAKLSFLSKAETDQIKNLVDAKMSSLDTTQLSAVEKVALRAALQEQQIFNETWYHSSNRETAVVWICRAIGLSPIRINEAQRYPLQDWNQIKVENRSLIEAALEAKIIAGRSDARFHPLDSLKRSEMAVILEKAQAISSTSSNQTLNGEIIETNPIIAVYTNPTTGQTEPVEKTELIVKNQDESYASLLSEQSSSSHYAQSYPVYKNGGLTTPRSLQKYEQIQYILGPQKELLWLEVIS